MRLLGEPETKIIREALRSREKEREKLKAWRPRKVGPFPHAAWVFPASSPVLPGQGNIKVAISTTTAGSLDQILPWLAYHSAMGVDLFFLFVEGQAATPQAMSALQQRQGVVLIPRDEELVAQQNASTAPHETWLSGYTGKPCNYDLFVRQSLNLEMGIRMAREHNVTWIGHVDTDELVLPAGAADFSLKSVLAELPREVDTLVLPNHEAIPESPNVTRPFLEVTLFKRNYEQVEKKSFYQFYSQVMRGNNNYFLTYANGKSFARMQPGLRPNGAHRFDNDIRAPKEYTHREAAILHYVYNRFEDVASRAHRCECEPTQEGAARCFMLEFDRRVFLAATNMTEPELREWYRTHVVFDDRKTVESLTRKGLFTRIHTPQVCAQLSSLG
eukprot:jgi/Mesvir1/790/Mv17387-RA.2